jgi:hypothetical protein
VQLAEAQQNAACNAIHDGSSQLCRRLLQCADRTGNEQLLMTQELLAEMLGVRRTTVTLLAQELRKGQCAVQPRQDCHPQPSRARGLRLRMLRRGQAREPRAQDRNQDFYPVSPGVINAMPNVSKVSDRVHLCLGK